MPWTRNATPWKKTSHVILPFRTRIWQFAPSKRGGRGILVVRSQKRRYICPAFFIHHKSILIWETNTGEAVPGTDVVRCPRPQATLPTPTDNVAHAHGQRCPWPWATNKPCFLNAEALILFPNIYTSGTVQRGAGAQSADPAVQPPSPPCSLAP